MNRPLTVAYIFERYPVLSQTFLRREIAGLVAQGIRVEIYSMLPASDEASALPDVPVNYFRWWEAFKLVIALPREILRQPAVIGETWRLCRKYFPNHRENFWVTLWAVIFALCRAENFRQHKPDILHGVRATGPATAAAVLSRLCRIPFSFGGHAYDIYRHGGDAFLEPKLRAASFVHTTTAAAVTYLRERAKDPTVKIVLARRGLEQMPVNRSHVATGHPLHILSIGRLVPKKGHTAQIAACVWLKSLDISFETRIVGDGPLRELLQREIDLADLKPHITLCGAQSQEEIQEQYRWADLFWHTGIVDLQGDRDGLPNVIPEAFAHALPVISNNLPGTTEALIHETNGLVVDVTNPGELAEAVKRLAENSALRQRLGENGRRWVEENFLVARNTEILAEAFKAAQERGIHAASA